MGCHGILLGGVLRLKAKRKRGVRVNKKERRKREREGKSLVGYLEER